MAKFTLDVSYSQVCVFDARLDSPFNDWTDEHVAQGFAWRPGSVSFGTLENAGRLVVEVFRGNVLDDSSSDALRILVVPFSVPQHRNVDVASIGSCVSLELPPGEYEFTFEHGRTIEQKMWANFYFRPVAAPVLAKAVRVDADLSPPIELVMTAKPA